MISRWKGVDALLLMDDPAGPGRDLNFGLGGERSADPSTAIGLGPSGSDDGRSCTSGEH